MPTQIQVRGAVTATQEARTLASRELDIDTTLGRVNIHNGATTGGIPHANFIDVQNSRFVYASAVGTNALTLTLAKAPTAYASGQAFKFKAQNTNTGSVTLNVNSLGAKTIKKPDSATGTLVTLDASDIIQNAIYTANYNGTDFVLEAVGGSGILTLVQSEEITTSVSEVEFLNVLASGYNYIVKFSRLTTSANGAQLHMRFSDDGGTSYLTTNDYDHAYVDADNSSVSGGGSDTDNNFVIHGSASISSNPVQSGNIFIGTPNDSTEFLSINFDSLYKSSGVGLPMTYRAGAGYIDSTGFRTANSFKLYPSSGNFDTGFISLYQIKA